MFSDPANNVYQFMLSEGMVVADLGAGGGAYTLAAAEAVGDIGRVYAVEVQKDLVSRVAGLSRSHGFDHVEVIWGDVERQGGTKLAPGSVDAAIAANLLFQVDDKEAFASEVGRILKPGGKVLIVDWADSFEGTGPHPDSVVAVDTAQTFFERERLVCTETIDAGTHHWGLICRKK